MLGAIPVSNAVMTSNNTTMKSSKEQKSNESDLETIALLEKTEEQRLHKAVSDMEKEERAFSASAEAQRTSEDERLREEANGALRAFRDKELPEKFLEQERYLEKDCLDMENTVRKKLPAAANALNKKVLSPDFLMLL